jgi:hypothetical protein
LELGILQKERLGAFLKAYGNPKSRCCVFLMVAPEPQFVFHNFKGGSAAEGEKNAVAADN